MIKLTNLLRQTDTKTQFRIYRQQIYNKHQFDIKEISMQQIDGKVTKNTKIWDIVQLPLWQVITGITTELQNNNDKQKAILQTLKNLADDHNYYYKLTNNIK